MYESPTLLGSALPVVGGMGVDGPSFRNLGAAASFTHVVSSMLLLLTPVVLGSGGSGFPPPMPRPPPSGPAKYSGLSRALSGISE